MKSSQYLVKRRGAEPRSGSQRLQGFVSLGLPRSQTTAICGGRYNLLSTGPPGRVNGSGKLAPDPKGRTWFKGSDATAVPTQHDPQALEWLVLAADNGSAAAQTELAQHQLQGTTLGSDVLQGLHGYLRAAEQGHAPALTGLHAALDQHAPRPAAVQLLQEEPRRRAPDTEAGGADALVR